MSSVESLREDQNQIEGQIPQQGVKQSSQNPSFEFDDYWIPSTDTINLPPSDRRRIFYNVLTNHHVEKFYLGILASQGPTVTLPSLPNILSQGSTIEDFLQMRDWVEQEGAARPIEIVPWFEGTGRI